MDVRAGEQLKDIPPTNAGNMCLSTTKVAEPGLRRGDKFLGYRMDEPANTEPGGIA